LVSTEITGCCLAELRIPVGVDVALRASWRGPRVRRLAAERDWLRTSSSGASGEADAILPVKDRSR